MVAAAFSRGYARATSSVYSSGGLMNPGLSRPFLLPHARSRGGWFGPIGLRFFVFLGLGWTAPLARADTYPRQPGVDALHYVFRVTLRDDSDEIAGEATAAVRFVKEGLTEFALDLAS